MWIQGLKELGLLRLVKSAALVRAGWLQPCLGPDKYLILALMN